MSWYWWSRLVCLDLNCTVSYYCNQGLEQIFYTTIFSHCSVQNTTCTRCTCHNSWLNIQTYLYILRLHVLGKCLTISQLSRISYRLQNPCGYPLYNKRNYIQYISLAMTPPWSHRIVPKQSRVIVTQSHVPNLRLEQVLQTLFAPGTLIPPGARARRTRSARAIDRAQSAPKMPGPKCTHAKH